MGTNPAALYSITCPVLIGRTPHLEALLHHIKQAHVGQGQTVLIAGEAGIGKSRLVREARALLSTAEPRTDQQTVLTLQGHCFEQDSSFPYAPLLDLLRPFFASLSPEAIATIPIAPELVKLLPELAIFLPHPTPSSTFEPEQEQRRLHEALLDIFSHLSAIQPLLLVIEDVHWCDDSCLAFLLFLARRIASHRILLLLTYRSEEEHPLLISFLTGLSRERLSTELQLSHLNSAEVGAMIRATFAFERPVRADFLETVFTLTEGSPFFIEEVLKSLVTSGEIVSLDGKWEYRPPQSEILHGPLRLPRSVQLAVQQRLDHLSAEARDLLSLAAVAGRQFDFPLLLQVTRREEAELVPLVKELITAQLVVEESEDLFVFRHALTRQAVSADLLARERRALHRLIAETLESRYADTLGVHLSELAHHFYAAREWNKVLEYAQRAGEQAQAFYAPYAAIEQYTHALEAAQHLSQLPPISLYRMRGQSYEVLGYFTAAHDDYMRSLEATRTIQDRAGEWQSLFDLGYLWTGRNYDTAWSYLHQALSLARTTNDPLMLARTLNRMGNWQVNAEQPQEGLRYHQEALDIFQTLADQRGLAETFDLLGTAAYNSGGGPTTGMQYYEQAIALWRQLGERQGLISSLVMLTLRGTNYLSTTMVWSITSGNACIRDAEEGLVLARQIGWRSGEALALCFLGMILGPRGEYTRALACAQAGLDIAIEIEHNPWMTLAHLLLGVLFIDLLAFQAAREHLEQARTLAMGSGSLFLSRITTAFLTSTYIAQQDLAHAEDLLANAVDLTTPPQTAAQRLCWTAHAELALAQRHPALALALTDQLFATTINMEKGNNGVIPRLWHLRAQALLALQRTEEAEAALRAALAAAQLHHAQPMLWRIAITLGKLSRARDLRTQAIKYFTQARTIIEEVGTNLDEERLRDIFLRGATAQMPRLPQPSPRRTAMQTFGGLTEREREVARLVAQGKSNRTIADELVVGERTIGTHVENILSKLGFTSRAQIAAWVVEKGLVKP